MTDIRRLVRAALSSPIPASAEDLYAFDVPLEQREAVARELRVVQQIASTGDLRGARRAATDLERRWTPTDEREEP